MQEIRDPACLETLYRKLELSSRTSTAKRPAQELSCAGAAFPFVFYRTNSSSQADATACRMSQRATTCSSLQQTLAHMVVQRGQGVLEDGDVQKPLEADLQDAQAAVHNEHQRGQQKGEGMAALEARTARKKPMARLPASPISRVEGLAFCHR